MFKIPAWEDDIPNSNASFTKRSKMKTTRAQNKPTIKKRSMKENKKTSPKNKSLLNHKRDHRIHKSKNNFGENQNTKINFNNTNERKGFLRKDVKVNDAKGSFLKSKEKNNIMMTQRLQNKSENTNISKHKRTVNNNEKKSIKNGFNVNENNRKRLRKTVNTKNNEESEKSDNNSINTIFNSNNEVKKNKRKRKMTESNGLDIKNFDNKIINAKKKKLNESLKNDDNENELFNEIDNMPKVNRKKQVLKKVLEVNSTRNHIEIKGNKLRERMLERLKAAQFRYLNEKLYTSSGSDAQQLFQSDPNAFQTYHQGYQQQLKKWPVNPLDVIVKKIAKMPKTHIIADMGCGEAALSRRVRHKVRSFDLVASAPGVEACDMAHTPLLAESVDVAVYCLALMGTDLTRYLLEANRVLKNGGHLLIAEVESRFDDVEEFTKEVQRLGFKLKNLDKSHEVFFFMEFTKIKDPPAKKSKMPVLSLKPCLYKRR